jgi:hypothetical protein
MPESPRAIFTAQCLGQIPGFDCIGVCVTGGTVTATCSKSGTWTIPDTASCPSAPQRELHATEQTQSAGTVHLEVLYTHLDTASVMFAAAYCAYETVHMVIHNAAQGTVSLSCYTKIT